MSGMIDAISELDKELVGSFGINIETQLILEDIQVGSLRAKLCYLLNAIDDDALKELEWKKAVGSFLVKGKQYLLKRLEEKKEIPSIEEIREIEGDIIKLAEETDVKRFPIYSSIQFKRILEGLSHLYSARSALAPGDAAYFISNEGIVSIPQGLYIPSQAIEDVLTRETMRSTSNMILRVKKPDYLGTSMWDVYYINRTISVKILDSEWLTEFQTREVDVRPGDSLRAEVLVDVGYGYDNKVVSEHFSVIKVIEVLKGPIIQDNMTMFDSDQ